MSRQAKIGNVASLLMQAKESAQPNEYLLGLTVAQKAKEGVEVGDLMATYMPTISEEERARRDALEAEERRQKRAKYESEGAAAGFRGMEEAETIMQYRSALSKHKKAKRKAEVEARKQAKKEEKKAKLMEALAALE